MNSSGLHIALETAIAAHGVYKEGDPAAGNEALRISRVLVAAYPRSERILQLAARLESSLGDANKSLDYWRVLVSGAKKGSEEWLEAKFNLITLIAQQRPDEALQIIKQHHALYPNYGDGLYGEQLKLLHETLKGDADGS